MKTNLLPTRVLGAVGLTLLTLLGVELTATPAALAADPALVTLPPGISDLSSPRTAISVGNPGYGYAQEFTITSGLWNVVQAQINLGDLAYMPGSPLMQVRNSQGPGLGPGTLTLGSFTMNPNDIPSGFNFANIAAPAVSSFALGPGTYWFCFGNNQPTGGFWVANTSDSTLVQSGVAGTVNPTAIAQSGDGGLTFGAPSLGGYALIMQLDMQPIPEPGVAGLLAGGFVLLAGKGLARRLGKARAE